MKNKAVIGAQIVLGLLFFVMGGLNYFLQFMETPAPTPEAGAFLGAMAAAGYFFPMIKVIELVGGAMLLVNRFVPFALVLLAPIVVGIVTLHIFLDPSALPISLTMTGLQVFLMIMYRDSFTTVFAAKPQLA